MKPLILSTRNIIPTGNKERPVVVRRTWSSTLINVLLGMLLLTFSVLHICVSGVEHGVVHLLWVAVFEGVFLADV